jgi:ubiquinone/menaquinone biosynthesis C-methylase UbiE
MVLAAFKNLRHRPSRDDALARYRTLADGYDTTCSRILSIRQAAIEALQLKGGETVFDVACGTGSTLVDLAERVGPEGTVIGIEQSPEMAARAWARLYDRNLPGRASVVIAAVEDAALPRRADALLLCYTHDVLQNERAVNNLIRHARPGARVAIAGMRFLPWPWGAPINVFTGYRARRYLTTYRGLRAPYQPLMKHCPDLRIVRTYHLGTSYVAIGTLSEGVSIEP